MYLIAAVTIVLIIIGGIYFLTRTTTTGTDAPGGVGENNPNVDEK